MSKSKDFTAATPGFAEALAFAKHHADSITQGPRAFHWSGLAWDLRRRYPEVGAKSLLKMGLANYEPAITAEQLDAFWSDADRDASRPYDESLLDRMRAWRRLVSFWERHHRVRVQRQYPPPPPLITR